MCFSSSSETICDISRDLFDNHHHHHHYHHHRHAPTAVVAVGGSNMYSTQDCSEPHLSTLQNFYHYISLHLVNCRAAQLVKESFRMIRVQETLCSKHDQKWNVKVSRGTPGNQILE
ncbi:hypothetical protein E2C01_077828 [Portunus trituberculatus]|uniref:Uncharacterized protein n=1 Tax=Portunus trituberculatus TaxID=210409 RepID=A0A5B7ILA6_PORTR|nr:hypothetical protein [Portunus trituberculatus]